MPKLKLIVSKLWTLIARLLTPTSWSISRGIGGFFGLAQATIQIQFG